MSKIFIIFELFARSTQTVVVEDYYIAVKEALTMSLQFTNKSRASFDDYYFTVICYNLMKFLFFMSISIIHCN